MATLVVIKVPYLKLPLYWDEAWSYGVAIFDMEATGPTLLPGNANDTLTRGHPLLYYFLSAVTLQIFGANILTAHIFSLTIACLALWSIFYLSKALFNHPIAMITSIAFFLQAMFLAQSTLLLPEIFLMLLSVWVVYAYLAKKYLLFLIFSAALVLTKETALVLIAALWVDKLLLRQLLFYKQPNDAKKTYFSFSNDFNANAFGNKLFDQEFAVLLFPVAVFALFLILQKLNLGYFFFPEHTGMMLKDFGEITNRFFSIFDLVFIANGRIYWFIVALPLFITLFVKNKITPRHIYFISFSLLFILAYILFSSMNFFSPRYILSTLPFLFLTYAIILFLGLKNKPKILAGLLSVLLAINILFILKHNSEADVSVYFVNTVKNHQNAVHFLEKSGLYDKPIVTNFLMTHNLTNPKLGYLQTNKIFNNVNNGKEPEVLLFYSCEADKALMNKYLLSGNYALLKRLEKGISWVEIYKRKEQ